MNLKMKVGVVSCSGECCSLGTVSRIATRLVLEGRDDTVTLCLPLFLAGEEGEHRFARDHPTVAVDGCRKECARRAISKYSKEPVDTVVVEDLLQEWGVKAPQHRRLLEDVDLEIAKRVASMIETKIEAIKEGE